MKYILIISLLLVGCSGGSSKQESEPQQQYDYIFELPDKIQDFAFDDTTGKLYTLTDGLLSTYEDGYLVAQENTPMGHQGLSMQYGVGLWSSGTNPNSSAIVNDKRYKIFDGFLSNVSSTPAISSDQRYLVAYGIKGGDTYLRVWDVDSEPDSDNYLFEFNAGVIVGYPHYGQGLASDGLYIYMVTGNSWSENRLYKWTMEGDLIDIKILPIEGEPEGLDFYMDRLIIGIWGDTFKLYPVIAIQS